jgi:hypothetical protein
MRASRGSDPSPPAQALESQYFSLFEAGLEMRENGTTAPPRGSDQQLMQPVFYNFGILRKFNSRF